MGVCSQCRAEDVQIRMLERACGRPKDERDCRSPVPCLQESFLGKGQESSVKMNTVFVLARTKPN